MPTIEAEVYELPDGDAEVMQWCARISSRLPDSYRDVLQTLARFADEKGHVSGPRQFDIALHSKVDPGMVSEALRNIETLGPIKSGFSKGKKGARKEYQLMGDYKDWTIGLSKDEMKRPIDALVKHKNREIEALNQMIADGNRQLQKLRNASGTPGTL